MALVNFPLKRKPYRAPEVSGHTFDPDSTYRFPAFRPTRRANFLGRIVDWLFGR